MQTAATAQLHTAGDHLLAAGKAVHSRLTVVYMPRAEIYRPRSHTLSYAYCCMHRGSTSRRSSSSVTEAVAPAEELEVPTVWDPVLEGSLAGVKHEVARGADIDEQDDDHRTPLHVACARGGVCACILFVTESTCMGGAGI